MNIPIAPATLWGLAWETLNELDLMPPVRLYAHRPGVCLFTQPERNGRCYGFRLSLVGAVFEMCPSNNLQTTSYTLPPDLEAAARQLILER